MKQTYKTLTLFLLSFKIGGVLSLYTKNPAELKITGRDGVGVGASMLATRFSLLLSDISPTSNYLNQ